MFWGHPESFENGSISDRYWPLPTRSLVACDLAISLLTLSSRSSLIFRIRLSDRQAQEHAQYGNTFLRENFLS